MRLGSPRDELVDQWLGIRTIGWRPAVGDEDDPNHRVDYLPTSYSVLRRVIKSLDLSNDDIFVDLGSGLGRAVFTANWLGAGRSIGVEIDPSLVTAARANLSRSRFLKRGIEFVEIGAGAYPQIETTVIYMYHPFGPATMREVATRIEEGLREKPRQLRIAYLNPVHAEVLDVLQCLKRYNEIGIGSKAADASKPDSNGSSSHAIFWQSI